MKILQRLIEQSYTYWFRWTFVLNRAYSQAWTELPSEPLACNSRWEICINKQKWLVLNRSDNLKFNTELLSRLMNFHTVMLSFIFNDSDHVYSKQSLMTGNLWNITWLKEEIGTSHRAGHFINTGMRLPWDISVHTIRCCSSAIHSYFDILPLFW